MDPADSLARVLGVPRADVELLARLDGGYGNASYRLRHGQEHYVLRVALRGQELPGVDREAERLALRTVRAYGLGPEVVFSDPASGLLVSRFLSGRRWTHADFANAFALTRLGERLAVLHSIPPPTGLRRLDLARHIADLEARARSVSGRLSDGARAVLDRFAPRATRLCHNDVHAGNVIEDDDIRLLDWEYAALGDPLFDLAGPVCCERIDAAAQAALVSGYRAGGGRAEDTRLAAALWIYDYVICLWESASRPSTSSAEPPVAAMQRPLPDRVADLERTLDSLDKPLIERHF